MIMSFISSKRNKSILAVFLTLAVALNVFFALWGMPPAEAVNQAQIDALKKQQSQLADQRADIQVQADELSGQVASQSARLAVLNAKLNVTNSELENLSEQIVFYTNTIAEMENELNNDTIREQQLLETYKKRIRVMEEYGSLSYITIVLGAASFDDLLTRINDMSEIMEFDKGLVDDVREAKVQVQSAKADMEAEMAEQENVFAAYQEKQVDLAEQQEEAAAILDSLSADSAEYESQLTSVKALQSSLSNKISNMEAQLAEQERIRAEQAAAAAAAAAAANNSSGGGNSSWYGDSGGTASGQEIVDYAKQFLGIKYVYGGTSPSGFDCSGLVYYCYRHFGYSVNRTATAQSYNGVTVSSSSLQPGDLIFFSSSSGGKYIGHVGIYVGSGQFIHAPHTGDVVKISSLSSSYYSSHYWGARRIVS